MENWSKRRALNTLDPDSGTVTYMGQTYTWSEFERITHGTNVGPCIGVIRDGRINAYDLGAPNALYCTVENGVSVWEIDLEGSGTFSFAVSAEQIASAFEQAAATQTNTVIGSDALGNTLYALSDGHTIAFFAPDLREAGKMYQFTFERETC